MKIKTVLNFSILLLITLLFSCTEEDRFNVDISNIKTEIKIKRLDKAILKFEKKEAQKHIENYKKEFGEFYHLYNYKIIGVGSSDSSVYTERLLAFLKYCEDEDIAEKIETQFSDISPTEEKLSKAFRYYNYYFPKKKIPLIYTCISGYRQSVSTGENLIAISLDKYLGYDTPAYRKMGWDNYKRHRMIPTMIPVDVMRAWAMADYPYESTSDNLLDNMIYQGKIQYFMDCTLPHVQDSLKWSYTKKQMGWAAKHENKIWTFLVNQKLLFTTTQLDIRKYVGDGPFTAPFAAVSAPRAGVFIGYKIV